MGFRQQSQARIQLIQAAKHGQNAGLDKVWQTLALGLGDQGLTVLDSYVYWKPGQAWPVQISGRFKQLSHSYRYLALLGPFETLGQKTNHLPGYFQGCKTTYSKHFLYNLYSYTTISWNSTGITYLETWRKLGSLGCCTSLYNVQPGKKPEHTPCQPRSSGGQTTWVWLNFSFQDSYSKKVSLWRVDIFVRGSHCWTVTFIPGFPKLCD